MSQRLIILYYIILYYIILYYIIYILWLPTHNVVLLEQRDVAAPPPRLGHPPPQRVLPSPPVPPEKQRYSACGGAPAP